MSLRTLEAEILREARIVFNNSKLRQKDIMEWTTGKIDPREDEAIADLPHMQVSVAVKKECDKRK